jgi:hypothetical protein
MLIELMKRPLVGKTPLFEHDQELIGLLLETLDAICAVIGNANSPMLFIIKYIYQCVCDAESGARLVII